MPLIHPSAMADFPLLPQFIRSIRLRILSRAVAPCFSHWYVNATGNYAVRAHAAQTKVGPQTWLTVRKGWHNGEYVYSYLHLSVPEKTGLRKAYRFACQQAEHLAFLRYRFL